MPTIESRYAPKVNTSPTAAQIGENAVVDIPLAPARVLVEARSDGSLVLRSPHSLGDPVRHVCDRLRHWAEAAPDRVFLAERAAGGGFLRVTYREARTMVDRLAQ